MMAASVLAFAASGCENQLGEGPPGVSIRGEVTYAGSKTFTNPRLMVTVVTSLTSPLPYAYQQIDAPPLPGPVPYQLDFVPEGAFYVIAVLDEAETFNTNTAPKGAYPNFCTVIAMTPERSIVVGDAGVDGIDITVYDNPISDPCFSAAAARTSASPTLFDLSGEGE
ncbi:MAG: hypothetical protein H5U40_15925 [Polyangiaceae bacterium]|nr:hypothetical protein [Polyangiaceae bacterium]